jgi:hypothetical protein
MLGMIPGNGHPYSWSAIINGYDADKMASCPYPVIPKYLGAQPAGSVRVSDAQVTHVWTDDPADARRVSAASLVPNVVSRPEDVIGHVDAVVIATDDGFDHARRARPFIETGLPVLVDKPLATSLDELRTFVAWHRNGARFLSATGLRFAPELDDWSDKSRSLGELRWLSGVTCKTWERYGIHLLEPLLRLAGTGFESVRLESAPGLEVAHLVHRSGLQLTLPVIYDGSGSFGTIHCCGTAGQRSFRFADTYTNFRRLLVTFIEFVRSGKAPFPFAETVELMAILIAGLRSRDESSRRVPLGEITSALS